MLAIPFMDFRFENKIDWIIRTERENQTDLRNLLSLFDGLNEQTERLSDNVKSLSDDSLNTTVLLREAYCMLNITVSSLNQIFTRLLEFLSPNQSERENSIDIGNAFLANLIAHSILDFYRHDDSQAGCNQTLNLHPFTAR